MPTARSLHVSRLAALADAGFYPTSAQIQQRLPNLVTFPTRGHYTVLDLTCGEGDFLAPFDGPLADLYGVEINGVRASRARTRLPHAFIVHAPYEETSIPKGRVSLGLGNFPYFYQNGERFEHLGLVDLTRTLQADGVMLTLLPARSALAGARASVLINHLVKNYRAIRVWRVPDDEFALYTQILIGAVKRTHPLRTIDEALDEKSRLEQWIYQEPDEPGESPWRGESAPPELPTAPIADPYHIPVARQPLQIRVLRPDPALLSQYLARAGVHTTAEWQNATSWSPGVTLEQPLVAIEGEAHIAACAMLDMFACETFRSADGRQFTFLAHLDKEWVTIEPDEEERKEGIVGIQQQQDKLQLSALDLTTGKLSHYQGEEVYAFLDPWLPLMKQRIQERYPPLYTGQPDRWLVEATATIGMDRTLRGSATPGLVREQLEVVWAMWYALCTKGRVGLAGEQGVGKTRLTITLMAAFAFAWRHAKELFAASPPRWITHLEKAWANNPLAKAVCPQALPCLIVCPLNVVESVWKEEIQAAWPEAECIVIEDYQDIRLWFERCVASDAPAVIALLSQSKTRATRRRWVPAVIRRKRPVKRFDLSAGAKRAGGIPVKDVHGKLLHYRDPRTGDPMYKTDLVERFFCPQCGQLILGYPMASGSGERTVALEEERMAGDDEVRSVEEDEEEEAPPRSARARLAQDRLAPVGSITYFEYKPRYCSCGSPLWTAARTAAVERKHLQLPFTEWARATEALERMLSPDDDHTQDGAGYCASPCAGDWKDREGRPLVRLAEIREGGSGPVCITVPDLSIDLAHPIVEQGEIVGYRLPSGEEVGVIYDRRTRRRSGYVSQATGKILMKCYGFVAPPADSFSPYTYLKRFFAGLVAYAHVDESHNARNRDTDVGESTQEAQIAAQTYSHGTGTPYGGLLKSFYYEQARLNFRFWQRLGFGWRDVGRAQEVYGFSRVVTREREEPAHRGSGRTVLADSRQSAPGLAVSLIPRLFAEWIDLSLEKLGAHLPDRIETPLLIPLEDPQLEERRQQLHQWWREAYWQEREAYARYQEAMQAAPSPAVDTDTTVTKARAAWQQAAAHLNTVEEEKREQEAWIAARDLRTAYRNAAEALQTLAATHDAAKLAQDRLLRLRTAVPFWNDPRYAISEKQCGDWGDIEAQHLLYQMPRLAEDYLYPLERLCYEVVGREVAAGRSIAIAFLQNGKRSTAARLQWVLRDFHPWTLTNDIKPYEREQAVKHAVAAGYMVILMPFQRTREGYNFQREIATGFWYEMPDRLFDLEQWQRRFWRLGQEKEVHLYFPVMIGTAAFTMLYRLGMMSAGLSLFLGQTPTSGLAKLVGAHKTALARLAAALAQNGEEVAGEEAEQREQIMREQIVSAFEQRNADYRALTSATRTERDDEVQQWIEVARRRKLGLPDDACIPVQAEFCRSPQQERAPASATEYEHPWEEWKRREAAFRLEQKRKRAEEARQRARLRRMLRPPGFPVAANAGKQRQRHRKSSPPLAVKAALW